MKIQVLIHFSKKIVKIQFPSNKCHLNFDFTRKSEKAKLYIFGVKIVIFVQLTYSIMSVESQRCLANFQCKPNLWYKWEFSQSSNFSSWWRVWKAKMIIFLIFANKKIFDSLSWIGKWQATLSIPRCNNSIGNRKIANARWSADFFAMSDWPVWLLPWTLQVLHVHAIRREIRCQND